MVFQAKKETVSRVFRVVNWRAFYYFSTILTACDILDARALYPDSSLADLYDETIMPPELRTAHQKNDRAVMEAYGFWGRLNSESECVAELMRMYQELVEKTK